MFSRIELKVALLISAAGVVLMLFATYISQKNTRVWQSAFAVSQAELTWMSSSMLLEHHRLNESLWRYVNADPQVSMNDLHDRLDIYWSRFDTLSTHFDRYFKPLELGTELDVAPDRYSASLQSTILKLESDYVPALSLIESRLASFEPLDFTTHRELVSALNTLSSDVTEFLLVTYERSRSLNRVQVAMTRKINQRLRFAYVAIAIGIVLFGAALMVFIQQKQRAVDRRKQTNQKLAANIGESQRLAEELEHRATHDNLSGLLNRQGFNELLDSVLSSGRGNHGLCFIDLDMFKIVNDTSGHAAGDVLIQEVSHLLQQQLPAGGSAARFGGDEFLLLVPDCDAEEFERIVINCCQNLKPFRFSFNNDQFNVSGSFGAVHFNAAEHSQQSLLAIVDASCYEAKKAGGARIHFHGNNDKNVETRRADISWVNSLQHALDEDRFCLFYQPIHSLQADQQHDSHGWEILVRMLDTDGSILLPEHFLDVAERYSLAPRIDRWVVSNSFSWINENTHVIEKMDCLNINLSGRSVGDRDFLFFLETMTTELLVNTSKICFEITESVVVGAQAREFLARLKELGYQLALDDFGTGFSSFGYLETLPVDYIKIDGLFVHDVDTNATHQEFVKAINVVGKAMGKKIVAEFVGNQEARDVLKGIGVDHAQGYHFGRPSQLPGQSVKQLDKSYAA